MKRLIPLFLLILLNLTAQETPTAREDLIAALMEARDEVSFSAAYLAGTQAGLPEQTLIEARFLYLVDAGIQADLAAYAPTLQKQLPKFSIDDSMIFSVKEDFESVIQYTLALAALEKNDHDLFKKHITEAFWLSPAQAGQFGPLITEVRLKNAMSQLTLDLTEDFEDQTKPDTRKSFKEIMGKSKAMLLHFWTPWARESVESMPEYLTTAKNLIANGIPSASMLLSGTAESRQEGDAFLKSIGGNPPGFWVVDRDKRSLVSILRVQAFPVIILIANDGKILFNGNPGDPQLWLELKKLNPKIERPTVDPVLPELTNPEETPNTDGGQE